jgi:hypothetical protein
MRKLLLLVIFAFITTLGAWAQGVTTSSINGLVTDQQGGPIPGANVIAIHQPSGTEYGVATNSNGRFNIPNMRVGGPYKITVSFVGNETMTYEGISLKLGEPYALNVKMKEGGVDLNEVIVTGAQDKLMNSDRNGATTSIDNRQIMTLPTITRSLNDMTRLTPQGTSTNIGAIGGGNYRQNNITIDGSDFNNAFGIGTNLPANGNPISLDAIEQISVNVTPYDVRQSGFIGSATNAVTRSGNNNFSGSVYTFFRNQNQQGNKVKDNPSFTRQDQQVNQYGFRLGGPILKNKLFFFVNVETEKKTTPPPNQFVASTPGLPYDPANPTVARPTATQLDVISNYLQTNYGYSTGPYQGYSFNTNRTNILGRIDWNINKNHRLNVRYSQVESKSPSLVSTSRSPLAAFAQTRTSLYALPFKNSNYYQEANFYSFAAELNSLIAGRFSNTLRGTITHQNDPRSSDSQTFPFVDILEPDPSSANTPYTSFGYEPFTYGNLRDVKTYSVIDNFSFTTGIHNVTAGVQFDMSATKNGFQRFGTGYYTFATWNDFVNGAKPRDYAITYSLLPNYEQAFPRFKFAQYSVYGQDEMNLSSRLKVTAGLRLEIPTYLNVKEIKTHPLVAQLAFANGENIDTGVLPENKLLWSPRVGFNYDVNGDRKIQLRGGTGIFTSKIPTVWVVAQSGDAGLIQFTQTFVGQANTPGPFSPDPKAYLPATPPAAGTAIPSTVSAVDRNFKFPQTWKTSLAVDVALPWGVVGTLEGIYNKDLIIAKGRNPNLVEPQALNVAGYPDNRVIYPNAVTDKFINPLTSATFNAVTNPNPSTAVASGDARGTQAFNPVVLDNSYKGYYWSLTTKFEKQFEKGFSAFVAYTHSQAKVLFDGSGDQLLNTWSLTQVSGNPNNPGLSYANYVVPDRIVASVSYRKEYLKHLATTLSLFYEGSVQGRFSYTYSSDFNRDGQTNDLIYIPKDASEITFVPLTVGSGATAVTYTPQEQSDLFFQYVEQDKYLKAHKGQYAQRNGATLPWRNQVDIRLIQDVFTNIGGKGNTLQFTLDIFNFGNFLNSSWGVFQLPNSSAILTPTNTAALTPGGAVTPTFRLATVGGAPITKTFRDINTSQSTYYMQFGIRYIFN